ncbi:MAG TPA: ImmA/IrrE family metallo-endopeptidase [Firmicutes bacterium]|nr:ImmA/IrrE family metallo-endopeptidase [Bacillota bacterium]
MSPDKFQHLFKLFSDCELSQDEVLARYDVHLRIEDLGFTDKGIIYVSRRGRKHILINKNLSKEDQVKTFFHEVDHLVSDLPNKPSILSIDSHYSSTEKRAEEFAQEIAAMLSEV